MHITLSLFCLNRYKVTQDLINDYANVKWFEMAGWKISNVLLDHNPLDTCLVKMWRTVGPSHEKFQTDLDCTRRKRPRRLIVADLK
jgi:hypothetical protein